MVTVPGVTLVICAQGGLAFMADLFSVGVVSATCPYSAGGFGFACIVSAWDVDGALFAVGEGCFCWEPVTYVDVVVCAGGFVDG